MAYHGPHCRCGHERASPAGRKGHYMNGVGPCKHIGCACLRFLPAELKSVR